jgi:hypothetical protein
MVRLKFDTRYSSTGDVGGGVIVVGADAVVTA